jgi:uncharacterized protein YggE
LKGRSGVTIYTPPDERSFDVTQPLIAAMLLLLIPGLAAAQQQPRPEPVIVTTGEGLVQAVPDRAWVHITAESRAGNPRDAQRRNVEAMAPVLDKLRAAGIPADAIKTIGYDLQQEWDFVNNRRVSRGYVARNTVEVRIDAIERVGELLEIAVGSGATSVGGIRFDLKDRVKLEREALRLAVADARAKAEAAAAGVGQSIARVVRIEEQGIARPPVPYLREMATLQTAADASAPPISAGQMELRAQVTLTAELK